MSLPSSAFGTGLSCFNQLFSVFLLMSFNEQVKVSIGGIIRKFQQFLPEINNIDIYRTIVDNYRKSTREKYSFIFPATQFQHAKSKLIQRKSNIIKFMRIYYKFFL
jgi:hypothetical protein